MIRFFDLIISLVGLSVALPLLLVLFLIGLVDTGAPIFCQTRLGKNKVPFTMLKFRTMRKGTASVPTHLADPDSITSYGKILRRSKLDEIPQLWNVLIGDMSLVGPRPSLPNQHELIFEREKHGVFDVKPGITGLAQVSNVDMSSPDLLAKTDSKMLLNMSLRMYFEYIFLTIVTRRYIKTERF